MKKFVITHINRDGIRQLTGANQGHRFSDSKEYAEKMLEDLIESNSDKKVSEVFGSQAVGTFEVREVECYQTGDAKTIYFETLKEYKVTIKRIESREHTFTVVAGSKESAEELAIEESYDHDFNQNSVSFADEEIVSVVEA